MKEVFASEVLLPRFNENYKVSWGSDHVKSSRQGREVQLSLDHSSGHLTYASHFFVFLSWILMFFIDKVPIRVFKNNTNIGVGYPTKPMQVRGKVYGMESLGPKTTAGLKLTGSLRRSELISEALPLMDAPMIAGPPNLVALLNSGGTKSNIGS
ncbi:hypothetical protein F0562_035208 [Nyssa sinensis]|uniref:Uncharacterized protein n=1 Tax=Nyssa sinensis TaxID=561372 RepID=A0A5J5AAC8_9ASTE|nr:hypothetical protein F0562_035208 [Nyssa sinensis]